MPFMQFSLVVLYASLKLFLVFFEFCWASCIPKRRKNERNSLWYFNGAWHTYISTHKTEIKTEKIHLLHYFIHIKFMVLWIFLRVFVGTCKTVFQIMPKMPFDSRYLFIFLHLVFMFFFFISIFVSNYGDEEWLFISNLLNRNELYKNNFFNGNHCWEEYFTSKENCVGYQTNISMRSEYWVNLF